MNGIGDVTNDVSPKFVKRLLNFELMKPLFWNTYLNIEPEGSKHSSDSHGPKNRAQVSENHLNS